MTTDDNPSGFPERDPAALERSMDSLPRWSGIRRQRLTPAQRQQQLCAESIAAAEFERERERERQQKAELIDALLDHVRAKAKIYVYGVKGKTTIYRISIPKTTITLTADT